MSDAVEKWIYRHARLRFMYQIQASSHVVSNVIPGSTTPKPALADTCMSLAAYQGDSLSGAEKLVMRIFSQFCTKR